MTDFYVFDNSEVGSLVYSINQLGKNIVGAEIGAYRAQCSCCLLQKCENIKKIYLVDSYKPHFDKIQNLYFDDKEIEFVKFTAHHHIKWSGYQHKAEFLECLEQEAADRIPDGSLDFVYFDAWVDVNSVDEKIIRWEKKVRTGGIFSGHDWSYEPIRERLQAHRQGKELWDVNNTWMWFKD